MLGANGIEVSVVDPSAVRDRDLLREYHLMMNEDERRRYKRYQFEDSRHQYLVTRALLRTTLSRYCPETGPAAWRFVEGNNGRPELTPGQTELPLRFNVSHTEGLIACAVVLGRPIGIDVEFLDRRGEILAVAERCLAPAELGALYSEPEVRRRERFFRHWTLKEAYLKARGLGLTIPLSQVAFDFEGSGPIRMSLDAELADDPDHWQFELERPSPRHVFAVGVKRGLRPDLDVRITTVVPLRP